MKYESKVEERGAVQFPAWSGERVYMLPFFKDAGLPCNLARWQPTVDAMLDGVDTDGPIYLMIDQGIVAAGQPHRRPGVHIDGYWNPGIGWDTSGHESRIIGAHGAGGLPRREGHQPNRGSHRDKPAEYPGNHGGRRGHMAGADSWQTATFDAPEGIILASSVTAARGLSGEFEGAVGEGGDCSHIDLSHLRPITMRRGAVYAGNVTMLHESLPTPFACQRILVRLNVPGWTP